MTTKHVCSLAESNADKIQRISSTWRKLLLTLRTDSDAYLELKALNVLFETSKYVRWLQAEKILTTEKPPHEASSLAPRRTPKKKRA